MTYEGKVGVLLVVATLATLLAGLAYAQPQEPHTTPRVCVVRTGRLCEVEAFAFEGFTCVAGTGRLQGMHCFPSSEVKR